MREPVTWNGSGRPSARRAIASPSSTALRASRASVAATTSGSRDVRSSSDREKTATSSPSRWTWMRAPSSFQSTAPSPTFSMASPSEAPGDASIGLSGRPTWSRKCSSPASPSRSAASATTRGSPQSMVARSTAVRGMPVAAATASAITPASAPWRRSPATSPRRKACSGAVAWANRAVTASRRAACEPAPSSAAMRANAASTSATPSSGASAGGGSSRSVAQPTPVRRWRSSPLRKATPGSISPGPSWRSAAPSSSALRLRERVAPTAAEVAASSEKSTPPSC